MATVVDELVVRVTAQMDQYASQLATMQRTTGQQLTAIERRYDRFGTTLRTSVSGAATAAATALGSIGAGLATVSLVQYADAWTRVGRAISGTEQVYGLALASATDVAEIAVRTRSDLEAVSQLYTRTAVAVSRMGGDMATAARVTETFSKALKLGGASTSEQASAILQFSQALQKGKLDGDEFRSIMENAGVVQQALVEQFRVSSAELFRMAEQGKITAKDIVAAMEAARPKIDAAFASAPVTAGEAFTNLKTRLIQYVGNLDSATGATGALGAAVQGLAENLDTAARLAAVVGAVVLAIFAPAVIGGVVAAGAAIGAAAATLGGAAVAAVGAATAVGVFADRVDLGTAGSASLYDVLTVLAGYAGGVFSGAMTTASDVIVALAQRVTGLFEGSGEAIAAVVEAVRTSVNTVIGVVIAGMEGMQATVVAAMTAIPAALVAALNEGLQRIEEFARAAATLMNNVPGVEIDVDAVSVGRLANVFQGSADDVTAIWQRASRAIGRDYIGEMTTAAGAVRDAVIRDADALAAKRAWKATVKVARAAPSQYTDPAKADPAGARFGKDLEQTRRRIEALAAEAAAMGQSTAAMERARVAADLLADAKRSGAAVTPELRSQVETLATAYGNAAAKLEFLRTLQQVKDETAAQQQHIQLVGLYGQELTRARVEMELLVAAERAGVELDAARRQEIALLAEKRAAVEALHSTINAVRDTSRDALRGFVDDLRAGKSGAEALGGALDRIADKLIDMAVNQLVESALGGLKGAGGAGGIASVFSAFGFAGGGVMTANGPAALPRFARGGVSTRAAIFGEAGPEAAVPLPDGRRIPVELRGLDAATSRVAPASAGGNVNVTVAPTFHLSGTVSPQDLAQVKAEVLATVPGTVRDGVKQAFDRDPRFRRAGV